MNSELYSSSMTEEEIKKAKKKGKLISVHFKTPKLQQEIIKNTKWIELGYLDASDFIRRTIDERLIEMGLLVRKNNKKSRL